MKEINLWNTNFPVTYYSNIQEVINYIKNNDIKTNGIVICDEHVCNTESKNTPSFINALKEQTNAQEINIIYINDFHSAFSYDNENKTIYINSHFYGIYKNEIMSAIKENYLNTDDNIVFDIYKPSDVANEKIIKINYNISDYENLALISDISEVQIASPSDGDTEDYYIKVDNIIRKLRENVQNNKVTFGVTNRTLFEKSMLYKKNYNNVYVNSNDYVYNFGEIKNEDRILNLIVKDINKKQLTELEKYISVYNIVKRFKAYKSNLDNNEENHVIHLVLNNDFIVCSGYIKLLIDLLERIGIKSIAYSVKVYEEENKFDNHSRAIVKINDDKYGVHGFYVTDPTWDNILDEDYYNHALISFDKTGHEYKTFNQTNQELIMNAKSIEDFFCRINIFLNEYDKSRTALINNISNIIGRLDGEYMKYLRNKHKTTFENLSDDDSFNRFLTEVGNYFIYNLGKDISLNTIIKAFLNVNTITFRSKDDYDAYVKELINKNYEMEKYFFPHDFNVKKVV